MRKAAEAEPPPALVILSRRLGLGPFEEQILLLCAAMELDTRIGRALRAGPGRPSRPYPTFALALALFDDPVWEALSPERPLRYWRLIEINQPGGAAADRQRAARRRARRQLSQGPQLSRRPAHAVAGAAPDASDALAAVAPAAGRTSSFSICRRRRRTAGRASAGRRCRQQAGRRVSTPAPGSSSSVYRLSADMLPTRVGRAGDAGPPVAAREPAVAGRALSRRARRRQGTAGGQPVPRQNLRAGVSRHARRLAATRPRRADLRCRRSPPPANSSELWSTLLGDAAGDAPARLAGQFKLNQSQTFSAICQPRHVVKASRPSTGCGRPAWSPSRPRLDTLAQRLEVQGAVLGRPRAAGDGEGAAAADHGPGRPAAPRLRALGLRPADEPRPRHQRAVCRRERHRQDDGGRSDRQRAAAATSTASTCPRSSASTSARPRRTCASCSTPPKTAARSCSSTRPTRCSASAAR